MKFLEINVDCFNVNNENIISDILKYNTTLTTIIINNNPINNFSLTKFYKGLQTNKTLRILVLWNFIFPISDMNIDYLASYLQHVNIHGIGLHNIETSTNGIKIIMDAIKNNKNIFSV